METIILRQDASLSLILAYPQTSIGAHRTSLCRELPRRTSISWSTFTSKALMNDGGFPFPWLANSAHGSAVGAPSRPVRTEPGLRVSTQAWTVSQRRGVAVGLRPMGGGGVRVRAAQVAARGFLERPGQAAETAQSEWWFLVPRDDRQPHRDARSRHQRIHHCGPVIPGRNCVGQIDREIPGCHSKTRARLRVKSVPNFRVSILGFTPIASRLFRIFIPGGLRSLLSDADCGWRRTHARGWTLLAPVGGDVCGRSHGRARC